MPLDQRTHDAIVQAAQEHGIDPSTALAIADRESSFNVNSQAKGSSAYGLFQLLKKERAKYGGATTDPLEQSRAWGRYATDLRAEMAKYLGRDPSGEELYAGHYWGGRRGANLATGRYHPETPVQDIFTPQELAANPNIVRAGTAGQLASSVMGDISRRRTKYGGEATPSAESPGLSQYGEAPQQQEETPAPGTPSMQGQVASVGLSQYGTAPAVPPPT